MGAQGPVLNKVEDTSLRTTQPVEISPPKLKRAPTENPSSGTPSNLSDRISGDKVKPQISQLEMAKAKAKPKVYESPNEVEPVQKGHKSQHQRRTVDEFRAKVHSQLRERINFAAAHEMTRDQLKSEISSFVFDVATETGAQLNAKEQQEVADALVDDMIGLGPLEILLADEAITDIMVNNAKEIFVEKKGRLQKTDVTFVDENHLLQIARRIANRIGRRIDEASPMVDARLADGSRVNIIVPPLALDGTSISIRKFAKNKITLDQMVNQGNLSSAMARVLKVASACRLNVLVSGGTGSGKTTLLNALSQLINPKERIVTIEDAAELKLQQPHVVRLESRPANIEGEGQVTIRDLVKNSLRMRPDRIIVGEVRGDETIDMMQAMNTGHDGSMSTIHANRPREVISRLENMISMAGMNMPIRVIRSQIVGAVNLIVHIERMRDGMRRVTSISEITGIDEDVVLTQEIFTFEYDEDQAQTSDSDFTITGDFMFSQARPMFYSRAKFYGLDKELDDALREASEYVE